MKGVFAMALAKRPSLPALYASVATHTRSLNVGLLAPGIRSTSHWPADSTEFSPCVMDILSVMIGSVMQVALFPTMMQSISAQDAMLPLTELRSALVHKGLNSGCPYSPKVWEEQLLAADLHKKYPHLPAGFQHGFIFNFPVITLTQTSPNSKSIMEFAGEFQRIVDAEISKGRYLGPFSRQTLQSLIGPFQSSPFSIIPKPGKPGKFGNLQNLSFPLAPSPSFPNPSVNSFTSSDDFPCTWGTFSVLFLLISRLPPGSQAAVRDVAEAYRTIPLHPSQWPATVARVGDDKFCIDTRLCFGATPSLGGYGNPADASLDIFRSQGMGPLLKWVDDHFFVCIRREFLQHYNDLCHQWRQDIASRGGAHQSGGRLWYGGHIFDDGTLEEFDEDCCFPFSDHSTTSPRSDSDADYSYNFEDIDCVSDMLGIP
jgi:hypothetical protein